MSGRKISNVAIGATDWTAEVESKNLQKRGFYNIEFNNIITPGIPTVDAGSSIDVDGVLYIFDADEAITGTPADGDVYVIVAGGATATASYTNSVPAYDARKRGFYVGAARAIGRFKKAAAVYSFIAYIDDDYRSFLRDEAFPPRAYVSWASTDTRAAVYTKLEAAFNTKGLPTTGTYFIATGVNGNYGVTSDSEVVSLERAMFNSSKSYELKNTDGVSVLSIASGAGPTILMEYSGAVSGIPFV